jgi:(p)ppGpp synthase/HD superfamily hydrolase
MTSLVAKALDFMRQAHASHKRKQGTPYADHPEGVFNILTNEFEGAVSENMQVIALLHDTLEMGETDEAEIALEFGPEALKGVKLRSVPFSGQIKNSLTVLPSISTK